MYTISKVAEKVGITTYTLRYYEKEGLLPKIEKNEQGIRWYTQENIMWIELIKCLKETGMPIARIKEIIELSIQGDTTIPDRKKILREHRKVVEQQVSVLQETLNKIDRKLEWYEDTTQICER